ncbi:hypothetical protein BDZ94DRAFT_1326278 [Collybia nuda]|uniref:BRCT domain-containing protein n=1 Tax=Collybia nuda TaxID=64659 RepID=A0A9P5XXM3_9AGAR|nr:hypothetical protein BDZ94DRAFT_1326278 [Collybia nuda]
MTGMGDISTTQLPQDLPKVFQNPDGSSWQIFVEAGGIIGRPKLIRLLRKAGATVCADPKQAQVILVDSDSIQGKLFIRDWGKDDNKVVLEHSWVRKSIAAQKILGEVDQWGGCLTQDDGLPIVKDELEDHPKSPLPTPRITPVETGTTSGGPRKTLQQYTGALPPQGPAASDIRSTPSQHTPFNPTEYDVELKPQSSLMTGTDSQLFYTRPPQMTPHVQPPHFTQLQPPTQHYHPSQQPTIISTPQYQAGSSNIPTQALMNFLNQPSSPHFGTPPFERFSLALVDTIKAQIMPSAPWDLGSDQNVQQSFYNTQMMISTSKASQDTQGSKTFGVNPIPIHNGPNESGRFSSPRSDLPPSLRRKSPVASRSSSSTISKGKSKAETSRSPSPVLRDSVWFSHGTVTAASPRSSIQSGTLFTSEKGDELSFFVQIDLNNRFSVVSAIKRNGGRITNNHTTADYAILYSRSKTFNDLLNSTLAADRPAVTASFVHDSVEKNMLLDPSHYSFDVPSSSRGRRKRARSSSSGKSDGELERKRKERNVRQNELRKQRKTEKESVKQLTPIMQIPDEPRPKSPTPPPEHTRIPLPGGGFKFSEHEREFVTRYVKILLQRDHQTSVNAMAQSLHKKINNHSAKSWRTFLGQQARDDIEATRKRMSIAYRKAHGAQVDQQPEEGPENSENLLTTLHKGGESSIGPRPGDEGIQFENDLDAISHFFAMGGGDEGDEDDVYVWRRLTNQVKCQTAGSWEEFYSDHHVKVIARYNTLIQNDPLREADFVDPSIDIPSS